MIVYWNMKQKWGREVYLNSGSVKEGIVLVC
jgi:hypothetical protein